MIQAITAKAQKTITIALAGNPNSGKTTLFNHLTGAHQHVGNYPGVTVEKKEGKTSHKGSEIAVIDLPGTYSLTAYSIEERVARAAIIDEKPDVIVDVVDSSNLERNLYLATQLMEMELPLILAFNMADLAKERGFLFDLEHLSTLLGVPIISTVGRTGHGVAGLLDRVLEVADGSCAGQKREINYGKEIEGAIEQVLPLISQIPTRYAGSPKRWLALKLIEQDKEIAEAFEDAKLLAAVDEVVKRLTVLLGEGPEVVIAERRYGFISGACQECVKTTTEMRHDVSDMIDTIVTHKALGLPIFLVLMYFVFQLTFTVGTPFVMLLEKIFAALGAGISSFWPAGSESLVRSLLVDGVIGGVGGVLTFLPNVVLLFMAIAVLEDTGYMARAAFVVDHIMHKIGLHGKSFIPMLVGFGCSVPAIMATRILESRRNRLTTIMVIPLMSCGARYPIYALIIPAFFPLKWHGPVMWLIYVTGIALAVAVAKILRLTIFKGETIPFVMELPPYRMPTAKALVIHAWERAKLYLQKAGTTILMASLIMWGATNFPRWEGVVTVERGGAESVTAVVEGSAEGGVTVGRGGGEAAQMQLTHSIAGRVGAFIEPAIKPLGFDWKIGTALVGAFAAKEIFVSQMGVVFATDGQGNQTLRDKLAESYSGLTGFCIMLFCLIAIPCMATVAITKAETGGWKWALFQLGGLTVLAYLVVLIVYQVGHGLGLG